MQEVFAVMRSWGGRGCNIWLVLRRGLGRARFWYGIVCKRRCKAREGGGRRESARGSESKASNAGCVRERLRYAGEMASRLVGGDVREVREVRAAVDVGRGTWDMGWDMGHGDGDGDGEMGDGDGEARQ